MNITFSPDLEARLNRIAAETSRGADEVVKDLVTKQLQYDEWFRAEVSKGLQSLDEGDFVKHEALKAN